jgi:ribosomal protein S18 acetylase RimI-like enzyme
MRDIIDLTFRDRGYKQISLSVNKANYAIKIYKKLGFEVVRENEGDCVMVLRGGYKMGCPDTEYDRKFLEI